MIRKELNNLTKKALFYDFILNNVAMSTKEV